LRTPQKYGAASFCKLTKVGESRFTVTGIGFSSLQHAKVAVSE